MIAYLGAVALACAVVVVPPLRVRVGDRAARLFDLRESLLLDRLAEADSLAGDGESDAALAILYDLDARFPARTNRHSLDREREHILHAIGAAELAAGRKGRGLAAYRAAVAFDPRNVTNHSALALAALSQDETAEAQTQFLEAFRLFPSHAEAVRNLIALRSEDADYAGVVEIFETYVDATRVLPIALSDGDAVVGRRVPVDGRRHELRVPVSGLDRSVPLEIRAAYPTVELAAVRWEAAARAGIPGRDAGDVRLDVGDPMRVRLPEEAIVAVLDVRTGVPIDADTWSLVETAYRNLLRSEDASAAAGRLTIIDTAVWVSAVLDI